MEWILHSMTVFKYRDKRVFFEKWWFMKWSLSLQCRRHKRCGYYPWVGKIPWRRKTATHSNILAWKIPWTEEPGRLRCKGLQRAGRTEQLRTPTGAAVTVWLIFIQSTQCICLFCSMTNGSLKVSDIALYTVWMRIIVYKNNS